MNAKNELLKSLPKVDEAIAIMDNHLEEHVPSLIVKRSIQSIIELKRNAILSDDHSDVPDNIDGWVPLFIDEIKKRTTTNLRRVLNGSGVVVHTNLGRSILSKDAADALNNAGFSYSNLEYNLATGKRGSRYSLVEDIICELTGAEAALVVNNNAAAVLLALDTLSHGKEVIVSRGQLVEIGGSFRIPEVMRKSGAILVEVGATNRTHSFDYENSITEETSMLLRVHTSNFKISGFTSDVSAEDLVEIAQKRGLVVMEDLGSGSLIDLSPYGLVKEPTVQEIVKAGVDVVTFSGDKLLGGPQAGIIVGKKEIIEKIKRNQLNRALRIDKFTLASLESILREYYDQEGALRNVPTLAMLTEQADSIKKRANGLARRIKKTISPKCDCRVVKTVSRVGGGAMPEQNLDSYAVQLLPREISLNQMEKKFRAMAVPLIGRIEDDAFLIDIRTIRQHEIAELADVLKDFFIQ